MDETNDWQTSCHEIKSRGKYLLKTGKWADCHFVVGSEPNPTLFPCHKLILAMASPVFDAMFFGGLAEKNDPIQILDVQPDAFKALVEYIYTDKININSMDKACELYYVAKKYMLPYVVEQCKQYLQSNLSLKNACRIYEFANLFEEPRLAERCLAIICTKTKEILIDPNFEDIELTTLHTILDQEKLYIESELDLFMALTRYAKKHEYGKTISPKEEEERANASEETSIHSSSPQREMPQKQPQQQPQKPQHPPQPKTFKEAVKKIRFLTMNPKQFVDNVLRWNILSQAEAFAILVNISSSTHDIYPMPDGFSITVDGRNVCQYCNVRSREHRFGNSYRQKCHYCNN